MKRIVIVLWVLAVTLTACTNAEKPDSGPTSEPSSDFTFDKSGVRLSADPGVVPTDAQAEVTRERRPNPLARLDVSGLETIASAAEITLDDGRTRPSGKLTVAIDVPRAQLRPKRVLGVVLQTAGDEPEFVRGRLDEQSSAIVVDVPHLSWIWPVQLDVPKMLDSAMTAVQQDSGIATAEPACTESAPTIDGYTYSVVQPAQAWVCLTASDTDLQVEVVPNSPVPFLVTAAPSPSSSTPLTDLGDESTGAAVIVRGLGLAESDQGMIAPGIRSRFSFDGARTTTLSFRSEPSLLLLQLLIASLQPILDTNKIETLGKAKCFHDLVQTAEDSQLSVPAAGSLTTAMFSCVGEAVDLTPAGSVVLALVSTAPQTFAGTTVGLIDEFTGQGQFDVAIEAVEVPGTISEEYLGDWFVHGGSLTIRADGTAESKGHSSCPSGWHSDWCDDIMKLSATMQGERLRLSVLEIYVQDENGRRGTPLFPSASAGSFYLMDVRPGGAAITELHNDDGVVEGANGLGNPFLCRSGSAAELDGICGA